MITTLYAGSDGVIYDAPYKTALGKSGEYYQALSPTDLIPLPKGAILMYLPDREAVYDYKGKINSLRGKFAVAAILPVGYTRTYLPAYASRKGASPLPLYGYTAAALYKDKIHVAALKSADNYKWQPHRYNTSDLRKRIAKIVSMFPQNRLVKHLADCSLNYGCNTAQNLFYERWEAGIAVSPVCNANCLGCISLQSAECCPAPQSRIKFTPDVKEIVQIGEYHLKKAPEGIISFGQGCEGEPSLAFKVISKAVCQIRNKTHKGKINMNTNAGFTLGLKKIIDSGLDSIRVSMISARENVHKAYYRADYGLMDVAASIKYAKSKGLFVSLNMLLFPGLNDQNEEQEAWIKFIAENKIDMIQLRNLNFDPDLFLTAIKPAENPLGVKKFICLLQTNFPELKTGSFTEY